MNLTVGVHRRIPPLLVSDVGLAASRVSNVAALYILLLEGRDTQGGGMFSLAG